MPFDSAKATTLRMLAMDGETKILCAEVLEVTWSDAVTRFYSWTNYGELSGFANIPFGPIEARVLGNPFREFEINPDLRTDVISIDFDDIDKDISTKFKRYGTVRCKLHYYWPDVDASKEVWHGQLQRPTDYSRTMIRTVATNGYKSRERLMPHSMRPPDHCRFEWAGNLTAFQIRTNGCPYNRHVGGTEGLLNGSVPFKSCPRTAAACLARFGHSRYFGGYSTDATATVSDGNTGYMAIARGNTSGNTNPIKVIAGTKHMRGAPITLWRREPNQNDPDRGWVAGVCEVGEGPVRSITNIKVNEKLIEQIHLSIRNGERGQGIVTSFNPGGTLSNFSGTGVFSWRYGWVNPINVTPQTLNAECDVNGYREVAVYNSTQPGNGLLGAYFADDSWTSETARRIDHNINFQSTYAAPMEDMPSTNFSIRWTGTITFPQTETFTISCTHDDGVKVWIDNTVIIDQLLAIGTHTGTFVAQANVAYPIRVDFYQSDAAGNHPWYCILNWSSPSTSLAAIPNSAFNHQGATGFVRQWTNDRVWWLMECYTNQRFGQCYDIDGISTNDFRTESSFNLNNVTFSLTSQDGETQTFNHRRTTFDAILEGRSSVEQVTDIARCGGLSIPFLNDGQLTIRSFRAATQAELDAAPVFSDRIALHRINTKRRIVYDPGMPAIAVQVVPDDQIANEITLAFEDATNSDAARPITVDDPNQKLKAGRQLGGNNLFTVPKRYAGFGIRNLGEAVKLSYRFLRFGEFDEGGTHNNCRVAFRTPYEMAADLVRYQIIKIESDDIDGHGYLDPFGVDGIPPSVPEGYGAEFTSGTEALLTLGESDDIEGSFYQFVYFRILNLKKVGNGQVQITAQAYNHPAYSSFETVSNPIGVIEPPTPGPGTHIGPGSGGNPCRLAFDSVVYDSASQELVITTQPC